MPRLLFGAVLAILIQASLGMAVNLYVTVPAHHPGSQASEYFGGSFHSVVWAIGHGAAALAVHATFGLVLVVFAVRIVIEAILLRRRAVILWSVVGAALVLAAGFNGASFLDYGHDANSLIMALLAFAAIASYAVAGFVLGRTPAERG